MLGSSTRDENLNSSKTQPPSPPGFTDDISTLKNVQLFGLLGKLTDKYQCESELLCQHTKETELLVAVAQFILSPDDKRHLLSNVVTIGQDLLMNKYEITSGKEIPITIDSTSAINQDTSVTLCIPTANAMNNDGEFSLNDLADEYLQDDPSSSSVSSSNDKSITPAEPDESNLTLENLSKHFLPLSPAVSSSSSSDEPIPIKSPIETILCSNRLSSHAAADDADCIWKEESSRLGQLLCTKTIEVQIQKTKHISTCLFDRNLYERLKHLIAHLPKQCIRNSVQQMPFRSNQRQQFNSPRPNNDHRYSLHRPKFQENLSYGNSPTPRFSAPQNSRQYGNLNYSNQQGNPGGQFVDRRTIPQHPGNQHQHQNRHSSSPQYTGNHQQQRRPPNNYVHSPGYHQQQQGSNDYHPNHHHRGSNRGSRGGGGRGGSNKLTNNKSGVPEFDPSLKSK